MAVCIQYIIITLQKCFALRGVIILQVYGSHTAVFKSDLMYCDYKRCHL